MPIVKAYVRNKNFDELFPIWNLRVACEEIIPAVLNGKRGILSPRDIVFIIENGTLIELPCGVGDTIYEVFKYHKPPFIQQTKVEKIIVTEKGLKLKLARNSFYETSIASLGKTLFLTEEAAETRLKELQEKQK